MAYVNKHNMKVPVRRTQRSTHVNGFQEGITTTMAQEEPSSLIVSFSMIHEYKPITYGMCEHSILLGPSNEETSTVARLDLVDKYCLDVLRGTAVNEDVPDAQFVQYVQHDFDLSFSRTEEEGSEAVEPSAPLYLGT
jgi:hypothetical protein